MAKVLLVEDSEDQRAVVAMRLRKAGHKVVEADGVESALAAVAERGMPEAAVLDVSLPDGDGYELLGRLRKEAAGEPMGAVFLSAAVYPEDVERGRAAGAEYLTKPFVANALLSAITRVVEQSSPAPDPSGW